MSVIEVRGVSFSYNEGTPPVLKNINLTVEKGEFLAVLGHNGSGKSTFAKLLNGILTPSEGTVTVEGMDTKDESVYYDIRRKVGMVFQNPDNQIVSSIVEEDIAFAPENLGLSREKIRERIDFALKAVGMTEFREHSPSQLSGGQKQRIAIAGVIAMRPEIIVLDEPTAMLDPMGRQDIIRVLEHLNKEEKITVVLITHHMDEAAKASRIVVMNDGEILMQGEPHDVFANAEKLNGAGLDVPQSTQFCNMLREEGFEIPEKVINVDECVQVLCRILGDVK